MKHSKKSIEVITERIGKKMSPVFKTNPGKTGVIFNKSHRYFQVKDEDKEFARNNFGMKIDKG